MTFFNDGRENNLSQEIIEAAPWLLDAKFKNAQIKIEKGSLIWISGDWFDGDWVDGDWFDGVWHDGTWHDGLWHDGLWLKGAWINGSWLGGEWRNIVFYGAER